MALSDFLQDTPNEEFGEQNENVNNQEAQPEGEAGFDWNDIFSNIGELIAERFDYASTAEREKFVASFAWWGALLASIVGIDDFKTYLSGLKNVNPLVKIVIVIVGMVGISIMIKPKRPKIQASEVTQPTVESKPTEVKKPKASEVPINNVNLPPIPTSGPLTEEAKQQQEKGGSESL